MDVQLNSTSDVIHKSKYLTKRSPFWVHKGPLRTYPPPPSPRKKILHLCIVRELESKHVTCRRSVSFFERGIY